MAEWPVNQAPDPPWPEVAQGGTGPLYGVFGEEDFLVSQAVAAFAACPDFAQNPSLNVERFHAAETKPARALESAQTLPFLGTRRLVMVLEADDYKADQLAEFLAYLENPNPSTTLVFAGAKLDQRLKFAKTLAKVGQVQVYKRMYPQQVAPWLQQRARLRGKNLEPAAAGELAELSGLGLGALDSELEKLCLYVGAEPRITAADVRRVAGAGRLYSIFDLTDAVAASQLTRALSAWLQLEALGEPPVRVVAMLQRVWRQLLEARVILDQGGGEREVQNALRIPGQASRTIAQRARREGVAGLAAKLERILAADVALKSSPASDRTITERLLLDLCA